MARVVYYIVKSKRGRLFRVREENLDDVPKLWTIFRNREYNTFYNKKTKELTIKFAGLKQLATKEDFEQEDNRFENEFEFLFGKLTGSI